MSSTAWQKRSEVSLNERFANAFCPSMAISTRRGLIGIGAVVLTKWMGPFYFFFLWVLPSRYFWKRDKW